MHAVRAELLFFFLLYHVSVPSPPTQQRRLKIVNSRCFKLHRHQYHLVTEFWKMLVNFLSLQYSTQVQEKIENRIISFVFYVLHEN